MLHLYLMRKVAIRFLFLFFVLWGDFSSSLLLAKPPVVGVIYPDIREPYRSVFLNIVEGIEKDRHFRIKEYVLGKEDKISDVTSWLDKDKIECVVALGSRGLEIAWEFPQTVKVIYGAVLIPPQPFPRAAKGITLTPDPFMLFTHLKKLTPHVNRITVVYNPEHFEWLITLAKVAADEVGFELLAFPVANFHDAATQYRQLFDKYKTDADAVWLLQDPSIIDERTILKLVLEEAWKKKLVVFSSNPSHVKKGILFSLYADNVLMGKSLGQIVRSAIEEKDYKYPSVSPVRDLLMAVNLRTAEHLGIKLTRAQKRKFSLIFPLR